MFIKTQCDTMIPISKIASIGPEVDDPRLGGRQRKVRTVDGATYIIGAGCAHLRAMLGVIVKANPGFEVVRYESDGEIRRLPVIAWSIGPQFMPAPITASMEYPNWEGDSAEYSSADVICPGGRVIGESGSFASVDEWKARIEEETIRAA
jgi:hypothetical protein